MTKVIPEELMRRARITQGLPPDPVVKFRPTPPPDRAPKVLITRGQVGRKFGQLTLLIEYLPGQYRCRCGACGGVCSFRWSQLEFRKDPTCGCVPQVVAKSARPPKGKATPEEKAARARIVRERQYALNKTVVSIRDLEGSSGQADFRTFHLRTSDWIGEGCRWVRGGDWPLDWERAW